MRGEGVADAFKRRVIDVQPGLPHDVAPVAHPFLRSALGGLFSVLVLFLPRCHRPCAIYSGAVCAAAERYAKSARL